MLFTSESHKNEFISIQARGGGGTYIRGRLHPGGGIVGCILFVGRWAYNWGAYKQQFSSVPHTSPGQ